jgi:ubiquitin fusion degradation protein 1
MNQLNITEGDIIVVENASLPLATFSKFEPQSKEFLDISNPKAVLESKLRSFACLTKDDVIGIEYNGQIYELKVLDTKPAEAVSIIECDMKVDFAAPVDYVSPVKDQTISPASPDGPDDIERNHQIKEAVERNNKFKVFAGEGQRLDGKAKRRLDKGDEPSAQPLPRGIPNYNYKKSKITFAKASTLKASEPEEPMDEGLSGFQAFSGEGKALRVKKKKK